MASAGVGILTGLLMVLGLAGTVMPGLPGIGFIFLGVLIFAWSSGFALISGTTVLVFGVVALLAWGADLLGSVVGARVAGGGKMALLGTIVGALIGLFVGPAGLLLGAFIGGFAGAALEGASSQKALKVALYTMVGAVGATIVQLLIGVAMVIAFLVAVFV